MIITDAVGQQFDSKQGYKRVISLVPSISTYLWELSADSEMSLVGRTKFCDYPSEIKSIPQLGGTKQVDIEKIAALQADLIILNKEENTKEIADALAHIAPTFTTSVVSIEDAYDMMLQLGQVLGLEARAQSFIEDIRNRQSELISISQRHRVAYIIWKEPYMTIGGDTFIHHMLEAAGLDNAYGDHLRYPSLTVQDIVELEVDAVLLSSEPYPFKTQHKEVFESQGIKTLLVDGALCSWYGSRMRDSWAYLKALNEELCT